MSSYSVQNVSTPSESDSSPIRDDIDIDGDGSVQYGAQEVSDPDSTDSASQIPETDSPVTMASRAYQLEMLDESLKQNIIVAVSPPRPVRPFQSCPLNSWIRWILGAAKRKCECVLITGYDAWQLMTSQRRASHTSRVGAQYEGGITPRNLRQDVSYGSLTFYV
jgi:hypothetical protein